MNITLLNAIAEITGQQDVKAVEGSLLAALAEHVPCQRIGLVEKPVATKAELKEVMAITVVNREPPQVQWNYDLLLGAADEPVRQCFQEAAIREWQDDDGWHYLIPAFQQDEVAAVLRIESVDSLDSYQREIGVVLKIYANYLYILRQSESDKLTGLYNRRTFDDKFRQLVRQQQEDHDKEKVQSGERQPLEDEQAWLGIIDIDHFKNINDNYGHLYGDEILLLLSQQMRKFFRRTDLLFRFGGEEFVVLLEPTNELGAEAAFCRFALAVRQFNFPQVGKVTISIGFSPIGPQDIATEVFGRADRALYYAKENGRNQVAGYLQLVRLGVIKEIDIKQDIDIF